MDKAIMALKVYQDNLYYLNSHRPWPDDHIRLLRPGYSWNLEGYQTWKLTTFSLKEAPPFAALSYSWGKKPSESIVRLDNGVSTHKLPITSDLSNALKRMRKVNKHKWLWVDALCINQTVDDEKSDQVGRMRSIYRSAKRVFVWLGEEMPDSHKNSGIEFDHSMRGVGISLSKFQDLALQRTGVWWARLWVVQEIVSCDDIIVCVGRCTTPWVQFVRAFCCQFTFEPSNKWTNTLTTYLWEAQTQIQALDQLRRRLRENPAGESIIELVRMTSFANLGFSNPLDRVYSLMGLAFEHERIDIPIKYGASITEVLADVVRYWIRMYKSVDVLFYGWPRGSGEGNPVTKTTTPGFLVDGEALMDMPEMFRSRYSHLADDSVTIPLPTWQPDFFRAAREGTKLLRNTSLSNFVLPPLTYPTILDNEDPFRASGYTNPVAKFNSGSLYLDAFFCDNICQVYQTPCTVWQDRDTYLACRAELAKQIEGPIQEFFSRDNTNLVRKLSLPEDDPRRILDYPTAMSSTLEVGTRWFGSYQLDGTFFVTQFGLVGCTTSSISEGYEVIVPLGSSTPAVVRLGEMRSIDGSGQELFYSLIGECYLHGIMHGELMAVWERSQMTRRTYELR